MKSATLQPMDVVPAPLLLRPSAALALELRTLLGPVGERRLRHLMDGRPVHVPGLHAEPGPLTERARGPRVRFLAGPLHHDETTGRWYGPVLPDAEPARATYVELDHLAHEDCADCAETWDGAAARPGLRVEEFEVMPGVGALLAVRADETAAPDGGTAPPTGALRSA